MFNFMIRHSRSSDRVGRGAALIIEVFSGEISKLWRCCFIHLPIGHNAICKQLSTLPLRALNRQLVDSSSTLN